MEWALDKVHQLGTLDERSPQLGDEQLGWNESCSTAATVGTCTPLVPF